MSKALVVFSGGQDSTTCLYWAKSNFEEVMALGFDYGQKHIREVHAAETVARMAGVKYARINAAGLLGGRSPLTNPSEELETYESAAQMSSVIGDRVELTFVPMRNAFFMTVAANYALVNGCDAIVTGICEEDGNNYPDTRASFLAALQTYTDEALGGRFVTYHAPLIDMDKPKTVAMAMLLPGCYDALAYTHTAYSGEYPPVTQDHATVLRADGFLRAGVPDPLIARAAYEGIAAMPDTSNYDVARELSSIYDLASAVGAARLVLN